jgi:Bifunctional DNA primase/polymerase, N-terminal
VSREKLDGALDYARRGWPVLPVHTIERGRCSCQRADCGSPGKHPLSKGWREKATTDVERIRQWWPIGGFQPNVGLVTGAAIDVLDVDGDEGLDTLSALVGGDDVLLPCGPVAITPSSGAHIYYEPIHATNRVKFRPGLDWRGPGGYVIAPPSVGANSAEYRWHGERGEIFDCNRPLLPVPGWLRALLNPPKPTRSTPTRSESGLRGRAYAIAALEDEARVLANTATGERNDALVRAAFKIGGLIAGGMLDPKIAAEELLAAAFRAGLPEDEARRTLASGLKAGAEHPRAVPA